MFKDVASPLLSLEVILEQITKITLQMQQCRRLEDIVQSAIADARTLLQTDRVFVYCCFPKQDAKVVFESVGVGWSSLLGQHLTDFCTDVDWIEPYSQAQDLRNGQAAETLISTTDRSADRSALDCTVSFVPWLEALHVTAHMVLPLISQGQVWGLLIVHHCHQVRVWQPLEVQYLQQMARQLGLAIQQADWQQVNARLQENESRLSEALKAAKAGVWQWNMVTNQTVWSEDNYRLLGYDPQIQDTSYDTWLNAIHPEERTVVDQYVRRVLAEQSELNLEYRVLLPNNQVRWLADIGKITYDASGQLTGMVGIQIDITARKQAELALQQLNHELESRVEQRTAALQQSQILYRDIAEGVSAATGEAFFYSLVECLARLLKMDHAFISELIEPNCDRVRVIAGISDGQPIDGMEYELMGSPCEQVVQQGFCLYCDSVQQCFPEDLYLQETGVESYVGVSLIDSTGSVMGLICTSHSQPIADTQFIEEVLTIFAARAAAELERQRAEALLRVQQAFTEQIAESTLAILYVYDLVEQRNVYCNPQIEAVLGYATAEIQTMDRQCLPNLIHPDDWPDVVMNYHRLLGLDDHGYVEVEYRMRHKNGGYRWLLSRDRIFKRAPDGSPLQACGVAVDISLFKETQTALCRQVEREQLLSHIAQHIRQTLDLENILSTAVAEVRHCLQTDRVLIYRFNPDWSGIVIAESVAAGWLSILGRQITDTYFVKTAGQPYEQGFIKATHDVQAANLDPCHLDLLEQMQVRAKLVVPILQNDHRLWGLLVAQHCRGPRYWQDWEIDLQQQIATQIAIAIQQSELYQQVQTLNSDLEVQVQQRTAELQQALDFEALLKRITDRVRDSLDEGLILQSVVEELVKGLALMGCDTGFYNADHTALKIAHAYTTRLALPKGQTFKLSDVPHPEVHACLLNGQICQFCNIVPNLTWRKQQPLTTLAVPICDDQETVGDLWLFRLPEEVFADSEIRLIQQVADQCAIALRQSRLYQAAQAQVKELERLNQLKDDFLSTVSHELRTPMSNIKMATQMLEINLSHLGMLSNESSSINRYVKVLQEEEEREINLINDLLDLTRLDAGVEMLNLTSIDLQFYIPHLAEVFTERIQEQKQHLVCQIPADLPSVTTDLPYLERIISELLNNACKYTPAGGIITVSAQAVADQLELRISNTGTEIAVAERDRIFDKFYRIPNHDPWKHGGTGLGLALVKKLTERLGGTIQVESEDGQTTFVLTFAFTITGYLVAN